MAVVAGMDVKASAVHGTSEGGKRGDAPNTKEAQDERRDHFRGLRTPNTVPNFGTGAAKNGRELRGRGRRTYSGKILAHGALLHV